MKLPDSPIRKVYECPDCKRVSVKFYDSQYNCSYSLEEWKQVVEQGNKVIVKLLEMHDPKFFS